MKTVLHICEYLNPFGGTPRKMLMLCRNMNKTRYKIIIAYHGPREGMASEFVKVGVSVIAMRPRQRWDFRIVGDIVRVCRDHRVDIMATHFARANIYGAVAARILNIPVISHEHGIPRTYDSFAVTFLDNLTCLLRHKIICNSYTVLQHTRGQLIARRSKFVVIPNSLDTGRYRRIPSSAKKELKRKLGFEDGEFIFGFFGSFIPQRDHKTLVRAFREVHKECPHARLLLVSDGSTRVGVESMVQAFGLTDSVIFLGYRTDISDLFQIIDAYVDTTEIAAGFALSLMEAMYFARPVITTARMHPNDSILDDKINGIRVEPHKPMLLADKMVDLMNNPKLTRVLGQNARKKILSECTPRQFVERTTRVYDNVC